MVQLHQSREKFSRDFFYSMSKFRVSINQSINDGCLVWIFIIPSAILLALFALPFFALFERSINPDFFSYAFSEQALKALHLSSDHKHNYNACHDTVGHAICLYVGALAIPV